MTQVGMYHVILVFVVYYFVLHFVEQESPRVVLFSLINRFKRFTRLNFKLYKTEKVVHFHI